MSVSLCYCGPRCLGQADFDKLAKWKKAQLKKDVGLF